MRDPKRIPEILARLQLLWERYPDMRLGQLLENVYPNRPGMPPEYSRTAYYKEDEDFITELEKFYSSEPTYSYKGKDALNELLKKVKKS